MTSGRPDKGEWQGPTGQGNAAQRTDGQIDAVAVARDTADRL